MFRRPSKSSHSRRGAAVVEAALVLPIFFLVVMGIIEFGRAFMVSQLLQNAARECCRKAVTGAYTTATVTSQLKSELQTAGLDPTKLTVNVIVTVDPANPAVANNEVANATTRDLVAVTVTVPFNNVALVSGKYLKGKTLKGLCTMRHE